MLWWYVVTATGFIEGCGFILVWLGMELTVKVQLGGGLIREHPEAIS